MRDAAGPLTEAMALTDGLPHCKRCKVELSGDERVCPECNYSPRQKGLRWAGFGVLVLVLGMMSAQLSVVVIPWAGPVFLLIGGLGFVFAFVTFLVAMVSTPHRFGTLFNLL